ncbi:MAG: gliding motility-associated C-terminal domain-containing protein [Phaeodactylibacter sp.]|nr:gliding motility-associated C-terminal domain-containing protein [Phaeodactylibacter sp.]
MKPLIQCLLGLGALCFSWFSFLSEPGAGYPPGGLEESEVFVDTCFADTSICPGDTIYVAGQAIAAPGTYLFTSDLPPECAGVLVLDVFERNTYENRLDITLCHGENARFGVYTFGRTGYYEIRLPARNGCDTIIYLNLVVSDMGYPSFQTQPDDGSGNGSIDLAISGDGLFFEWSNGATTEDIDGLEAGRYEVVITNADSCRLTRNIEVKKLERFAVPNTFTPNGDGINDYFNLLASEGVPRVLTFQVFNRWGQMVYDNENPEKGWDGGFNGEPQVADTYFYRIQVQRQIGPEEVLSFQGDVVLLR